MCLGLDLFGAKKAAKIQAEATLKSANMQAASDREVARANTLSIQSQLAQDRASDMAAELLSTPQESATVILSPEEDALPVDEATGRRKSRRSQFFSSTSGVQI